MKHIIISTTTANKIKGKHGKYSEIYPIALGDGKFLIPENVLSDEDLQDIIGLIPVSNPRKTIEEIKLIYPDFQKEDDIADIFFGEAGPLNDVVNAKIPRQQQLDVG